MIATVAPALAAARAARCPASPAPMMRTSCAGMSGKPICRFAPLNPRAVTTNGTTYDGREMPAEPPVRVMVVDDQPDARFLVRVLLSEHDDLELVAEAADAAEALEAAVSAEPDVALLDARMPRIDGFELAPRLLAAAPGLRIGLLTSLLDDVVEARAREAGIAGCLAKGDLDGLPALVRRLGGR